MALITAEKARISSLSSNKPTPSNAVEPLAKKILSADLIEVLASPPDKSQKLLSNNQSDVSKSLLQEKKRLSINMNLFDKDEESKQDIDSSQMRKELAFQIEDLDPEE